MPIRFIFSCIFWGCLLSAFGQQTLDDYLKVAEQQNLKLQVLEQDYRAVLEKVPQVGELPDPQVAAGVFVLPVETRLGAQRFRIGATQMFPWKGTLKAKEDVVLAGARAQFEKIAAERLNILFDVKKSWYELYEISATRQLINRNIRLFESLQQLTLSGVESGKGSAADVLRVQLKIQDLQTELKLLDNKSISPTARMNSLLNRSLDTQVAINDSLVFAVLPYVKDSLEAIIKEEHPILRMFELQQDVSRQQLKLNTLSGKPTFGVGLDYVMVTSRSDADPDHNGRDILMPRASVTLPVFRKKYAGKEEEETLKIAALETRKEEAVLKFMEAVETAFANHQDAAIRLEFYQEQIKTLNAAISILQTDYSTSGKGFDELLRLQIELVGYDLMILKAIVKSHMARAAIERFIVY